MLSNEMQRVGTLLLLWLSEKPIQDKSKKYAHRDLLLRDSAGSAAVPGLSKCLCGTVNKVTGRLDTDDKQQTNMQQACSAGYGCTAFLFGERPQTEQALGTTHPAVTATSLPSCPHYRKRPGM